MHKTYTAIIELKYSNGLIENVLFEDYEQYLNDQGFVFDAVLEDGNEHTPQEVRVFVRDADGEQVEARMFADLVCDWVL